MKPHLLLVSLLLVCTSQLIFAQRAKKRVQFVTVKGLVTQTSSWCGGMKPSEEVMKDKSTPKPLAGKTIYIKIGTENSEMKPVYKKVVTDENGAFSVKLKSGVTYIFLEDWKGEAFSVPKNTELVTHDADCYKKQYSRPDYSLFVKGVNKRVIMNFHERCAHKPLCGTYHGKLPQ